VSKAKQTGLECSKAADCATAQAAAQPMPPCPAATFASAAVNAALCHEPCGERVCSILGCQRGDKVCVTNVDAQLSCSQRLAELGILAGAELTVLKQSEPLLVLTRDSRIAIDRQTAARIEVSYAPGS